MTTTLAPTVTPTPRKPRKPRLTTLEARALRACQAIAAEGAGTVSIEWRKSRTWGHCPSVLDDRGEKLAGASGCGYDKESAALADALRFLFNASDDRHAVHRCGGCGVSAVQRALAALGWDMRVAAETRSATVYDLTRTQPAPT